jgi:hypothetical protein
VLVNNANFEIPIDDRIYLTNRHHLAVENRSDIRHVLLIIATVKTSKIVGEIVIELPVNLERILSELKIH